MRFVIFDFDGTIHLEETPRIFLRVLSQDKGMRKKIRKFYISMAWVYILYRFGLCRQLAIRETTPLAIGQRGCLLAIQELVINLLDLMVW